MKKLEIIQKARELRHDLHCNQYNDRIKINELSKLLKIDVAKMLYNELVNELLDNHVKYMREILKEQHSNDGHRCSQLCGDARSDITDEEFLRKHYLEVAVDFKELNHNRNTNDIEIVDKHIRVKIKEMEKQLSEKEYEE